VHRKYASLVNIDVGTLLQIAQAKNRQNHEKNIQKKYFISDLPTLFFHDMKPEPQVFCFYALVELLPLTRVDFLKRCH
jgi:hypothetical protein